jgi:outer membrane protein assembly factor BamB
MSVVLLLVGICSLGDGFFRLDTLIFRSWKVGVVAAFLSLVAALLLVVRNTMMAWIFAFACTILSVVAYAFVPRQGLFLDFGTPDGIAVTSVVLAPALVAWTLCLGLWLVGESFRAPEVAILRPTGRSPFLRFSFWGSLLSLLTIGLLWTLDRVIGTGAGGIVDRAFPPLESIVAEVQSDSTVDWTFLTCAAILSLGGIGVGIHVVSRSPWLRRVLLWSGVGVSALLAVSCSICFGVLRAQRQVATAVICIDRITGSIRWLREVGSSGTVHDFKGVNSYATPTIAAGSDRISAYFGSTGLFGLDRDGSIAWKVQDAEFESPYGVGHSPVVADGIVILANDNERSSRDRDLPSFIIGYNLQDGRVLWRQERNRSEPRSAGFSSPSIVTIRGQKTVLMRGWEDLTAYDLHTGEIRWTTRLRHRGNHLVAGIAADDKRVYVLDGIGVRALDLDVLANRGDATVWMLQVPGEKAATPALVDGLLYVATETGIAYCINADQGTVEWKKKLGKRFFSSVVAHGRHVIFVDEFGDVSIVSRGRIFELITQMQLGEKVYTTPAPQLDGLLIRAVTNLYYLQPKSFNEISQQQDRIEPKALKLAPSDKAGGM